VDTTLLIHTTLIVSWTKLFSQNRNDVMENPLSWQSRELSITFSWHPIPRKVWVLLWLLESWRRKSITESDYLEDLVISSSCPGSARPQESTLIATHSFWRCDYTVSPFLSFSQLTNHLYTLHKNCKTVKCNHNTHSFSIKSVQ
jgi:hypothetical protein